MKAYACLSAILFFAAPWVAQAEDSPVRFARSGQRVSLPLVRSDLRAVEPLALVAFGRRWDLSMELKDGVVEFIAPKVRVPVVFQFVTGPNANVYFSAIVIYPERDVSWNKNLQLVAVGGPCWFDQWSDAVGLPVTKFEYLIALRAGNWRKPDKPGLLIVEKKRAAGAGPVEIERVAAEHQLNLLVLDADWFGKIRTAEREFAVMPKQMAGALADIQGQNWVLPPNFHQYALPWKEITNRRAWIAGPKYPLVEEIISRRNDAESPRIVLSYLPWQEQLGRCEVADELFLRLLTEAVKRETGRPSLSGRWRLLYPEAKDVKAAECPVLAAALHAMEAKLNDDPPNATDNCEIRAYVLDLRSGPPPPDFFESPGIKTAEGCIGKDLPLLILGDNPLLDTWKWLKLDRGHHRSSRSGVLWRPDDSLPPSLKSQLRLMQRFTEWNIFLGKSPEEENDENPDN